MVSPFLYQKQTQCCRKWISHHDQLNKNTQVERIVGTNVEPFVVQGSHHQFRGNIVGHLAIYFLWTWFCSLLKYFLWVGGIEFLPGLVIQDFWATFCFSSGDTLEEFLGGGASKPSHPADSTRVNSSAHPVALASNKCFTNVARRFSIQNHEQDYVPKAVLVSNNMKDGSTV